MHPLVEERQQDLARLCARHAVRRLEIFGSATTDRFDPAHSDLDFLVEFEPGRPREMVDRYFGLLEDLRELFGTPVDLVMAKAIKNSYFLQGIEASRMLLYALGEVTISPSQRIRGRYRLEALLAQMPEDYKPAEEDWGAPVGREVWRPSSMKR